MGKWGRRNGEICHSVNNKNKVKTTIKDTWTKSRGRVEAGERGGFGWGGVEGWGERTYNCN